MALFSKKQCALNPCCASPKLVVAVSSRLKILKLMGTEKGFVAFMIGVENVSAAVVAGGMLSVLP